MGRPLWREDGTVVYNCCWPSPAQLFSGSSPEGIMTIFYCLRLETPPTWRARSPYLYPPGTGFPFHRLVQFAGLRWRYSNPPPRGYNCLKNQSQSYCTTGSLPPISSSWRQTPETHDQRFFQLNPCGHSPYVTSSLTRRLGLIDNWHSLTVLFITSGHEPHRKHRYSIAIFNCCRVNVLVCEAVSQ
jgi:hypothetical protein